MHDLLAIFGHTSVALSIFSEGLLKNERCFKSLDVISVGLKVCDCAEVPNGRCCARNAVGGGRGPGLVGGRAVMAVTAQGPCSQTFLHRCPAWSGVEQDHCHLMGVLCIED